MLFDVTPLIGLVFFMVVKETLCFAPEELSHSLSKSYFPTSGVLQQIKRNIQGQIEHGKEHDILPKKVSNNMFEETQEEISKNFTQVIKEKQAKQKLLTPNKRIQENKTESPLKEQNYTESFIVLPMPILSHQEQLISLGIPELIVKSKLFELPREIFSNTRNQITIPNKAQSLFLFNMYDRLVFRKSEADGFAESHLRLVKHSVPFELPNYFSLNDYYLILPEGFIEKELGANPNILREKLSTWKGLALPHIPTIEPFIKNNNLPFAVFEFSGSHIKPNDANTFKSGEPFTKFKYQKDKLYQSFCKENKNETDYYFDTFAENWIRSIGYEPLIHANFCTKYNTGRHQEGFCITIRDNNKKVHFSKLHDLESRSIQKRSTINLGFSHGSKDESSSEKQNYEPRLDPGLLSGHFISSTSFDSENDNVHMVNQTSEENFFTEVSPETRTNTTLGASGVLQSNFSITQKRGLKTSKSKKKAPSDKKTSIIKGKSKDTPSSSASEEFSQSLKYSHEKLEDIYESLHELKNDSISTIRKKLVKLLNTNSSTELSLIISEENEDIKLIEARNRSYAQVLAKQNRSEKRELLFPEDNILDLTKTTQTDLLFKRADKGCEKITWFSVFHRSPLDNFTNFCL